MKRKLISVGIALMLVLSFGLVQAVPVAAVAVGEWVTLNLENKDADWQVISDNMQATLKYNTSGPRFWCDFMAAGLEPDTRYALIYYADTEDRYVDWGGDNPGALIAGFVTNADGYRQVQYQRELNMNLPCPPDANAYFYDYTGAPDFYAHATGAKIWVVPMDCLTDEAALPVVKWQPARFLFETDLIQYEDTDLPLPEVWVDDDWDELDPGFPADGHSFGYDAFAVIQDGIKAVDEAGTVNVAAGDYGERVTINKPVTLLGANAGIHPAVGTHPTEEVGERVEEAVLSQPGTKVVTLEADDITIDGFMFTGEGHQTIYGYADSNNFHLTNCIFDNYETAVTAGVIEFSPGGSLSHTDVVFDFNLFQDKGAATIYTGGFFDRLRIAYNKFNVLGDGVFWTAETLVDGIIEGNEFDGTIDGTPGTGGTGLNIGKGGNIIIRDNWFHDMANTGFQVGIIGGSVINNTFEDTYPLLYDGTWYPADAFQLWGGEWGTPVSTDVTIAGNTIKFNNQSTVDADEHGIRLRPGADAPNIHIHFNNFVDGGVSATALAVRNDGTGIVDAINNWWGDVSGPIHSPGYGARVGDNVLYNPWLFEPVVPGESLPTTFDKTLALNIGWTLVSTDKWISANETVGVNVTLAYNYAPSLGYWEVTPADLVPVNALYLKTEDGGGVGITYSGGVPVASSKDLEAGWNLISSATIDNAKAILSPLRYVQVGEQQGVALTTLVSQGAFNQHTGSFYLATLTDADWGDVIRNGGAMGLAGVTLNPFDGYWVYMNAPKNFGVIPN